MTGPSIASDSHAPRRCDTVVVGAGLTGLVTAVLLARAGQRVTVLESRRIGDGTTGNTTGKLSLLQGTVLSEVRDHAGDDVLQAYAEANREGQAWLLRQLETDGIAVERRPAFTYVRDSEHQELLEEEFEAASVAGVEAEWARTTGLPFETAGAFTLPDQAQLQPLDVLVTLARELRERDGVIVEHCPVRDIDTEGDHLEIETDLGTMTADRCVLATGTPILDRGLFFAKHEPSRAYVSAYRVPYAEIPRGMYLAVGGGAPHSLRTAHDGTGSELLVVGGESHVAGRGSGVNALREIDGWVSAHFPVSERVTWWAAQDYRSHTRVPFAGPLPRGGDRIYTATGFNKWGMTNGVAAGLTIAADMLGGHLEWAMTLREHNLKLPAVRDALAANTQVAAHLASDWADAIGAESRDSDAVRNLEEGRGRVVRDGAKPVAVSRVDGRVCAVSGICTHLGGVLSWNRAERTWDCPLHGSRFAPDGTRLEGPATEDLESFD
ncbi:FAD-dependent oxidoreductase [Leucobacter denitrificans]|uniref:FAD-dependent oxidoreductase n=2 Tax=Leucobacter denitrificans TaxID=683042 RepID=A0A7G9S7P3_9MICO|nr:FAD-dependent oxidoreductase [Leucobacter denitrificans]